MLKAAVVSLAAPLLLGSVSAFAVDVNIDLGGRRGPPVVVEGPSRTVIERVWVPERVIERTERIQEPPRYRTVEEQVLIEPARIENVQERVLVRPERIEREYVPPVVDRIKLGPVYVNRTVREGYWRENRISAEYQTVYREIRIPAKYRTVTRRIEEPGRWRDVVRREVIPGHWEERTVVRQGPPIVVEPPRRGGIDIDINLHKHDKDRR